jgi:hypothetical protein
MLFDQALFDKLALSGWFVIGCDSAEYYCDAYASEPTVDQSFAVHSFKI